MEVIKKFPADMDKRTEYKLCKSPEVRKMTEADGSVLEIKSWIKYTDVNNMTGEQSEVLTIETVDGEMFGTISGTFQREFDDMVNVFGDDVGMIKVFTGRSKAGRTFITCTIE